ncbi:MAG: hypothetical protein FD129_646 [bacterium]|nr:MAG: hypothetical protein FD129_646 [bacterium]
MRPFPTHRGSRLARRAFSCALVVAGLGLAACQIDSITSRPDQDGLRIDLSLDPGAAPGNVGGFYPLSQGNRWHYEGEVRIVMRPGDGPPQELTLSVVEERVIDGVETIQGRDYQVERQSILESGDTEPLHYWVRERQDGSGLFEADVDISDPPGAPAPPVSDPVARPGRIAPGDRITPSFIRNGNSAERRAWARLDEKRAAVRQRLSRGLDAGTAPTGVPMETELTRLRYPLHPGQGWNIRFEPPFRAGVEGMERLDLPAGRFNGWRIRIEPPGDPSDDVHVWYGRCGFLRLAAHLEVEIVEAGSPTGTLTLDQEMSLADLDLVDRASCGSDAACVDPPFHGITRTREDGTPSGPVDPDDWGCATATAAGRGGAALAPADIPPPPPLDTCLDPAYPNPADELVRFDFSQPAPGPAALIVYGIEHGNGPPAASPVRTLLEGQLAAGQFTVLWDLRAVGPAR